MREANNLSQADVALKLGGITQGAISQWESGAFFPSSLKLMKLAQLYRVTEREIIQAITAAKEANVK